MPWLPKCVHSVPRAEPCYALGSIASLPGFSPCPGAAEYWGGGYWPTGAGYWGYWPGCAGGY